jgi:hypothetical protein
MALADPQTFTVDSTPYTLNRVKSDGYRSEYASDDEAFKLTVSHQESKDRTRRMIRIDNRVVAADPLTSVNEYKSLGVYIVIDEPEYGFADEDIEDIAAGLFTLADGTFLGKVLSNQH